MGIGLSQAESNCLGTPERSSMKLIRIQPGSNVFVAAMEVRDGEEFIVWLKNIGKFGVP